MPKEKTKSWNGKSRGGALGYWFFVWTLRHLGLRPAYVLLAFVAPYFVFFAPKSTKATYKYLRHILRFGRAKAIAKTFALYYSFGKTIVDKLALKHGLTEPFEFHYDEYEPFLRVLDSGRGAIIISAHVGSWEIGSPFFHKYGKAMNIVMLDAEYEKIKHIIEKDADAQNFKVIALTDDGIGNIIKIKNALDKHEYVCLQGDRYMSGSEWLEADFMGHTAQFPKGVFTIAAKMRVPVIFFFAMRGKSRHYNFTFEIADTQDITPESLLKQYTASLEKIVRQYPLQWYNFYEFWSNY